MATWTCSLQMAAHTHNRSTLPALPDTSPGRLPDVSRPPFLSLRVSRNVSRYFTGKPPLRRKVAIERRVLD